MYISYFINLSNHEEGETFLDECYEEFMYQDEFNDIAIDLKKTNMLR